MQHTHRHLALAAVIAFVTMQASADCWRAPDGRFLSTAANSSPPVSKAVRVPCPASTVPAPALPKANVSPQPSADICAPYYGKGYCTDYITQRMGNNRPKGDPRTWPVNRDVLKIREGTAVVFAGLTSAGHVAYVEQVNKNANGIPVTLEISEMNYARGAKAGTPASCLVTPKFGVVGRRIINISGSGISGFWP